LIKGKFQENRDQVGLKPKIEPPPQYPKTGYNFSQQALRAALLFTTFLMCFSPVYSHTPKHQSPVLWVPTSNPVIVEYTLGHMEIYLINPCDLVMDIFPSAMAGEAKSRCNQSYHELILDPLNDWCPSDPRTQSLVRSKRFDPFTICLLIVAFCAIGTAVGGAAMAIKNTQELSSEREKVRNLQLLLEGVEDQVVSSHMKMTNLTKKYNQMVKTVEQEIESYQIKGKIVQMMFMTSHLISRFHVGKQTIQDSQHLWKNGKLSSTLLNFFNISLPCKEKCPVDLVRPKSCILLPEMKKTSDRTLRLQFTAPIVNPDIISLKAEPFKLMVRKGNKVCTAMYTGPLSSVVSKSEKCVLKTFDRQYSDNSHFVPLKTPCSYSLFSESDQNQFVVQHCEPDYPGVHLSFIEVKAHDNQFFVYCPESNVTIDGNEQPCGQDILVFPSGVSLSINGAPPMTTQINVLQVARMDDAIKFRLQQQLSAPVNWSSLIMDEGDDFRRLTLNDYHPAIWTTVGTGTILFAVFVGIVVFCWYQKRHANQSPTTMITLIPQNAPSAPPKPAIEYHTSSL
jgi:hypothetical protein